MIFYKYYKAGNLELSMLRHREVFFASRNELNDATECLPNYVFVGSVNAWTRFLQHFLGHLAMRTSVVGEIGITEIHSINTALPDLTNQILKKVGATRPGLKEIAEIVGSEMEIVLRTLLEDAVSHNILEEFYRYLNHDLIDYLESATYIASFSKTCTNPTMWGHYADAEKGFSIIFQTEGDALEVEGDSDIPFLGSGIPVGDAFDLEGPSPFSKTPIKLRAVEYGDTPPTANAFWRFRPYENTDGEVFEHIKEILEVDPETAIPTDLGFRKFSDWQYEREIRAVFHPIGWSKLLPEFRSLKIPPSNYLGIIFGRKMPNSTRERLVRASQLMLKNSSQIDSNYNEVPFYFFEAESIQNSYELNIIPVGLVNPYALENDKGMTRFAELNDLIQREMSEISNELNRKL